MSYSLCSRAVLNVNLIRQCPPISRLLATSTNIPQPPKKPLNSYNIFVVEKHKEAQAAGQSPSKLFKDAADCWKTMSEEEKEPYTIKSLELKKFYEVDLDKFNKSLSPEQVKVIKKLELKKEHKKKKKLAKSLGKPKYPTSPYMLFVVETFKGQSVSPKVLPQLVKDAAIKYKNLSEEKKQFYSDKANKEKERYLEELAKWEEKMVRAGHSKLVRKVKQVEAKDDDEN